MYKENKGLSIDSSLFIEEKKVHLNEALIKGQVGITLNEKEINTIQEQIETFFQELFINIEDYPELKEEDFKQTANVLKLKNQYREDIAKEISQEERERLFAEFPERKGSLLRVPKIL